MNRVAVVSEALASVGYDSASRVLEIKFNNGRVYRYSGVPIHIYYELITAESIGRYFNANIRDNAQYPYRRVI